MSPVVKQCDRKSVQLWWLSSVVCPSTFSSRSLTKVHLKCTVCSLWMTHPQENELYDAGSLANKHFTICRVYWSTMLTYCLNPQTTNTNSDKPILFDSACKAQSEISSCVFVTLLCDTCNDYHQNTQQWDTITVLVILFTETANLSSLHQLPETNLSPKPAGVIQCMSVCSLLPFTATSMKHCTSEWMGDSTSLWLGSMQTFKWLFVSWQPFKGVPFRCSVSPPLSLIVCSMPFFCHICLCCLYYKVCH